MLLSIVVSTVKGINDSKEMWCKRLYTKKFLHDQIKNFKYVEKSVSIICKRLIPHGSTKGSIFSSNTSGVTA